MAAQCGCRADGIRNWPICLLVAATQKRTKDESERLATVLG